MTDDLKSLDLEGLLRYGAERRCNLIIEYQPANGWTAWCKAPNERRVRTGRSTGLTPEDALRRAIVGMKELSEGSTE